MILKFQRHAEKRLPKVLLSSFVISAEHSFNELSFPIKTLKSPSLIRVQDLIKRGLTPVEMQTG